MVRVFVANTHSFCWERSQATKDGEKEGEEKKAGEGEEDEEEVEEDEEEYDDDDYAQVGGWRRKAQNI